MKADFDFPKGQTFPPSLGIAWVSFAVLFVKRAPTTYCSVACMTEGGGVQLRKPQPRWF